MKSSAILTVALMVTAAFTQTSTSLETEMARLYVHTALLVRSQEIDEFPVWSPDSRFLGVNIRGKWFKVDTSNIRLRRATWHEQLIGVVEDQPELQPMTSEEASEWARGCHHGDSEVRGSSGFRAEMQRDELSSSLVVSRQGHKVVLWKSDLENCGALSLSPNGARLAYICELNGVLVMDVGRVPKAVKAHS